MSLSKRAVATASSGLRSESNSSIRPQDSTGGAQVTSAKSLCLTPLGGREPTLESGCTYSNPRVTLQTSQVWESAPDLSQMELQDPNMFNRRLARCKAKLCNPKNMDLLTPRTLG